MQRRQGGGDGAEEAALRLVQQHAAELLHFARRYSHCADDAHDAYQRTLEILVRRLRREPPAQPLAWVRTVLRREALAVRAEREQLVGRFAIDFERHENPHLEDPAERALGHERLRHTAQALRRLKPQELTALALRAEGLSYREICARTGWTYTRTNRTVTEGRRALLERLGAIESGAECARWLPLLSALADGEATATQLADVRPHLRECPACRATLREAHAVPAQVAALVPAALLPAATAGDGSLLGHAGLALHGLGERLTLLAARVQGAFDAVPGTKLAAVAASTAALAGGGVAVEQATRADGAPRATTQAADISAAPGGAGLMPIGLPIASAALRDRRGGAGGEFASRSTPPPEFGSGASPGGEFVAEARPSAAAAAAKPPPAAPPAADPSAGPGGGDPSKPPEFAGP